MHYSADGSGGRAHSRTRAKGGLCVSLSVLYVCVSCGLCCGCRASAAGAAGLPSWLQGCSGSCFVGSAACFGVVFRFSSLQRARIPEEDGEVARDKVDEGVRHIEHLQQASISHLLMGGQPAHLHGRGWGGGASSKPNQAPRPSLSSSWVAKQPTCQRVNLEARCRAS